jgi:hypothetical protein
MQTRRRGRPPDHAAEVPSPAVAGLSTDGLTPPTASQCTVRLVYTVAPETDRPIDTVQSSVEESDTSMRPILLRE